MVLLESYDVPAQTCFGGKTSMSGIGPAAGDDGGLCVKSDVVPNSRRSLRT